MQGSVGWLVARGYYFSIQFAAKQDQWRSSECFCLTISAKTTCYCSLTFQVFVEGGYLDSLYVGGHMMAAPGWLWCIRERQSWAEHMIKVSLYISDAITVCNKSTSRQQPRISEHLQPRYTPH